MGLNGEQKNTTKAQAVQGGLQGAGGLGRDQGRKNDQRIGGALRGLSESDHEVEEASPSGPARSLFREDPVGTSDDALAA